MFQLLPYKELATLNVKLLIEVIWGLDGRDIQGYIKNRDVSTPQGAREGLSRASERTHQGPRYLHPYFGDTRKVSPIFCPNLHLSLPGNRYDSRFAYCPSL